MTVLPSSILKSANASLRHPMRGRDQSMPIGATLRDLYIDDRTPKTDGRFSDLLGALDDAESSGRQS